MSAAENDAEFAALAIEMIEEFGVSATWKQSGSTAPVDFTDGGELQGGTNVNQPVSISPPLNDDRLLKRFSIKEGGHAVAYARPSEFVVASVATRITPGATFAFPHGDTYTYVTHNRLVSGEEVAMYELLLKVG